MGLFYQKGQALLSVMTNANLQEVKEAVGGKAPHGYADASFAEEEQRRSRSGHVFFLAGAAITWFCKKQTTVALSSTEAE